MGSAPLKIRAALGARRDPDFVIVARTDAREPHGLDEAIDRVVAGPQKRSRLMNDEEKKITAYHEGGHALVGFALPEADPIHKITISGTPTLRKSAKR